MSAQRLNDLSGAPGWATYATLRIDECVHFPSLDYTPWRRLTSPPTCSILPAPISTLSWLGTGLVLSASDHLFFYSSRLSTGLDAHSLAASRCAPLPLHHPQLLFQALLEGHFDAVVRILSGLAAELTHDGSLTPLSVREKPEVLTLDAFLRNPGAGSKVRPLPLAQTLSSCVLTLMLLVVRRARPPTTSSRPSRPRTSAISASVARAPSSRPQLTHARSPARSSTPQAHLSQDDMTSLLAALKKRAMRGLSKLEHEHLAVVAQTVFEVRPRARHPPLARLALST